MKYIVFYEGNVIKGQGFYSNPEHIPKQHPHIESTKEIVNSGYPLEIYEKSGKKKVRINEAKKAEIDAEKNEIEAIKAKVKADEELTNKELAKLIVKALED